MFFEKSWKIQIFENFWPPHFFDNFSFFKKSEVFSAIAIKKKINGTSSTFWATRIYMYTCRRYPCGSRRAPGCALCRPGWATFIGTIRQDNWTLRLVAGIISYCLVSKIVGNSKNGKFRKWKFRKFKILTPKNFEKFLNPNFVYFGIIRSEMMKIKIFWKFKILTPLIFGPPKFCNFWKPLLNCTPVPNLVIFRQRVSELEGIMLKNGIVPCGHNFDPSGSSLTWHIRHTRVHLPCKFQVLRLSLRKKCPAHVVFVRVHAAARGTCHVARGATWPTPSSFRRFGAFFGVGLVRIGFADPELLTKTLEQTHIHTNSIRPMSISIPSGVNLRSSKWTSSILRHYDLGQFLST